MNNRELELKMLSDINLLIKSNTNIVETLTDLVSAIVALKKEVETLKGGKK